MSQAEQPCRARVRDAYPHHCDVEPVDHERPPCLRVALSQALPSTGETIVVAGDWVDIQPIASLGATVQPRHLTPDIEWAITRVHPRTTKLSRPGHSRHGGERFEQCIVANVDLLAIVVSVAHPPFHPNLVDRFLVAAQRGEIEPIICLNKIDLLTRDAPRELKLIDHFGVDVIRYSALTGEHINELHQRTYTKTVAFVGHSGVGKSATINALFPELDLKVGTHRKGDRTGRHVTTRASLRRVDDQGTMLVDTPGIKSFAIWGIEPGELHWYFPEFDDYWPECRFNDCTHTHEVGCAVKEAVEQGGITRTRYDSYVRLYKSMRERR